MKTHVDKNARIIPVLVFLLLTSFYCSRPDEDNGDDKNLRTIKKPGIDNLSLQRPEQDKSFALGENVEIALKLDKEDIQPDSIQLFARNDRIHTLPQGELQHSWSANLNRVGRTSVRAVAFYGDSLRETEAVNITLLSDIKPGKVNYTILNEYPHDPEAFTQGLVYDNGYLFESTGHYGKSTVRKVDVETGEVIKINQLGQEFFGEGLAIYDSRLFQLTWKEQVGFIFDKDNFNMVQKVYYDIKEGWGLTYDGEKFILSDGTSQLYFMDPTYFTETGRLEVYDNKGMVPHLNELEYIKGKIFANIWGKKIIAVIDPNSGKVTHYLDFSSSTPDGLGDTGDKVLNGIAYNPDTENLYITGKYWPVLFELSYSLQP